MVMVQTIRFLPVRSLPEFDALLHRAGLQRTAVLTADSPHSVIEAVAA